MSARHTAVTTGLELRLVMSGATTVPVRADFRYDAQDPYAVHVSFHTGSGEVVEWTFARQLLTDGVTRPTGEGDVQVWPSHGAQSVVCLALSSPSGRALFEAPLTELVEFLSRTYTAVPTGSEGDLVDVDAELALLLWSEPDN